METDWAGHIEQGKEFAQSLRRRFTPEELKTILAARQVTHGLAPGRSGLVERYGWALTTALVEPEEGNDLFVDDLATALALDLKFSELHDVAVLVERIEALEAEVKELRGQTP